MSNISDVQIYPSTAIKIGPSSKTVRSRWYIWVVLGLIIALAAWLRFSNLEALGLANHYYTAAVKAMLQSWHNFFFVAAEPGGSVSIDKPPLGLWLQAASAAIFGVNGFGVLLPELLCGVLSVGLLFHLVRRTFGDVAGLVAALALAVMPVSVAVDRNNTMDSILIFTLLLAAWMYIKATETGKFKWLAWGAVFIGLGFNIKMLEAFLPLPAFYLMYLAGSHEKFWKKVGKSALSGVILLVISMSWMTVVDLTPASERPYVGSSSNNTVFNLVTGYNGIQRLAGMQIGGPRRADDAGRLSGGQFGPPSGIDGSLQLGEMPTPPAGMFDPRGFPEGMEGFDDFTRPGDGGIGMPGGLNGQSGMFNTGEPGVLRMFSLPLAKNASWLLPFSLLGLVMAFIGKRLRLPLDRERSQVLGWGMWLITSLVFFSVAGFFHEYYLSILAPALAALVGIGVMRLADLYWRIPWLGLLILGLAMAGTVVYQAIIANSVTNNLVWLEIVWWLLGFSLLAGIASLLVKKRLIGVIFLVSCVTVMFIVPGAWSGLTNANASANQSLPAAYGGNSFNIGGLQGTSVDNELLKYLEANTQGMKYMLAVPSSMQGADYVIESGRGVMYMGGFSGNDQVVDVVELQNLVNKGDLRFIYLGGGNGPNNTQSSVSSWVQSNCSVVSGFDTSTRNQGAPDGLTQAGNGNLAVSLYDCAPGK